MSRMATETLIEQLAAAAQPVRPLRPPLVRALLATGALLALLLVAIWMGGDTRQLAARYPGREWMLALELTAMLATGLIAITGAFSVTVPGTRARPWLVATAFPTALWVGLAGVNAWIDWRRFGASEWEPAHSQECLIFLLVVGTALGVPLMWRLARARPIDPLPVAVLGGLGAASFAVAALHFFHPFTITFFDLGVHLAAILILILLTALLRRRALRPA